MEKELEQEYYYYCRNCGKEYSDYMNFRKDRYGREVCPYCESRKIDKKKGKIDSFYD